MTRAPARWWLAGVALVAGCPGKATPPTGEPSEVDRFPRLTHAQWERTVQDLLVLGDLPGLAGQFHPDPQLGRFDNNIARLDTSGSLWRDYEHAAEVMAERVAHDPGTIAVIVPPGADARTFIASFGKRTFRRPLADGELDRYQALFDAAAARYPEHDGFTAGVRLVLETMLQSPFFLYRAELADAVADRGLPLDNFEVAARLSYALWNTMPDDRLFTAASGGDLDDADGVRDEAERLFDDARAVAQLQHFHFQAYKLADYADLDKDPALFPGWRRELGPMMQHEVELFLSDIVASGRGVQEILTSTRAFVNGDLAAIYGVGGVTGDGYRRVDLPAKQRGGLLTRLGFLARNATLDESDPIHRGVFINLDVVCRTIAQRPNVPTNLMPVGDTTRERVTSITGPDTCGEACHANMINPLGFAFERYDAIGAYRDHDRGFPIDSSAAYMFADGRSIKFTDGVGLGKLLAKAPEVHACYVAQLYEFLLGRAPRDADRPMIVDLAARSLRDHISVKEIVLSIVGSRAFRSRALPEGGAP